MAAQLAGFAIFYILSLGETPKKSPGQRG